MFAPQWRQVQQQVNRILLLQRHDIKLQLSLSIHLAEGRLVVRVSDMAPWEHHGMETRLRATDPLYHLGGTRCDKRVWLRDQGEVDRKPASDFKQALAKLGEEHEQRHAEQDLPDHLDLGGIRDIAECADRTRVELEKRQRVIYQGAFRIEHEIAGIAAEVVGLPDFMLPDGASHIIRDAKLARTIERGKKPGIFLQLQLYGWLYEETMGLPPTRLEVLNGRGELVEIERDNEAVMAELEEILRLRSLDQEPFEVVGWSKCQDCDFTDYCWPQAEEQRAPGVIPGVDVGMGRRFAELGVSRFDEIPERFEVAALAEMKRPWGKGETRVGPKQAGEVMAHVRARLEDLPVQIGPVEIPESSHHVMFDLEGLPPEEDGPDKVYLWGMQLYPTSGGEPEEPTFALAGFDEDGDREAWEEFLRRSARILDQYGEDTPFVHWASYEKTKINLYVEKYGDRDGIAEKLVERNLLDLLPVTKGAFALPLPSYSLKVVERYVGYERTKVPGYKGDQSIARYMVAVETDDEVLREAIVSELCDYNHEDLEATWAIFEWLLAPTESPSHSA